MYEVTVRDSDAMAAACARAAALSRNERAGMASATLNIVQRGVYCAAPDAAPASLLAAGAPSSRTTYVPIEAMITAQRAVTVETSPVGSGNRALLEVELSNETLLCAAQRVACGGGGGGAAVVVINAVHADAGEFTGGADGDEAALCRAGALDAVWYRKRPRVVQQRGAEMVRVEQAVFFRDATSHALLPVPYCCTVLCVLVPSDLELRDGFVRVLAACAGDAHVVCAAWGNRATPPAVAARAMRAALEECGVRRITIALPDAARTNDFAIHTFTRVFDDSGARCAGKNYRAVLLGSDCEDEDDEETPPPGILSALDCIEDDDDDE